MIKVCNTNRREILKRYLFFLIPCFIIVFVSMYYIDSHISIKITGDEYGYWAAGAYLNGLDWSPITAYNSYYGYGYGLILALILKIGLSSSISYKIAIGLNVFFLLLIYGIVYHLITSFSRENEVPLPLKSLIALAVCLYPGNLAYTQYTMPEVLLSLLYWIIILLLYELLNKVSIIKIFLLVIVVLYCFSVHQRTIGICFVAFLLLLIIVLKKHVNIRLLILTLLFAGVLIFLIFGFKKLYQSAFYVGGPGMDYSVNDFGGQIGKIKSLFSFDGIWMLIKAFCGKIFYALSSSFLLVLIPILVIFYGVIRNSKNRNLFAYLIQNRILIVLFMLLSWIMMMLIGSIYMLDYAGRLDFLIYGRYFEFTISPLIFVAFMYLITNKKVSVKIGIVVSAVGYILLTYCINHIIDYSWSTSNIFISCPGIADFLLLNDFGTESLWLVSLRGIIMFFVIVFLPYVWPKIKMYTFIGISILLCMIWIYGYKIIYEDGCLVWANEEIPKEIELKDTIENMKIEDDLHYFISEDVLKADYLQFLLKDHTINVFSELDEIEHFSTDDYILTIINTSASDLLEAEGYNVIAQSGMLKLWEKQENV